MRTLAVLIVLVASVFSQQVSYKGYRVYLVVPKNPEELEFLLNLSECGRYDFWSHPNTYGKPVHIMVDPYNYGYFEWLLLKNSIYYEIYIKNVQSVVTEEQNRQSAFPQVYEGKIRFDGYNRHDVINKYLDDLQARYPQTASVVNLGKSYEGRDVKLIKIARASKLGPRPIIFIQAGAQAREWSPVAFATYIISQLVENPANDYLLSNAEWHILPVVNPDGYEYSHTSERLWKKTRSLGSKCRGVNMNNNYGVAASETAGNIDECSQTYMGKTPFSEVETQIVADYIRQIRNNLYYYLDLHNGDRSVTFPCNPTFAYDTTCQDNLELALKFASATGYVYTIGTTDSLLYRSSGRSDQWVKGETAAFAAYTVELPGISSDSHDLLAYQLEEFSSDTFAALPILYAAVSEKSVVV